MGWNEKHVKFIAHLFAVSSHCAGQVTIASGTTVASVQTLMADSGTLIMTFPQQFATFGSSGQAAINTQATSIGDGRFIVQASPAPAAPLNVGWVAVARSDVWRR